MKDYKKFLDAKPETQEMKSIALIDGFYHKQILYVTRFFGIPKIETFCGKTGDIVIRKHGNCTCEDCKNMTLQDAIDRIEKRVPKVVDIVELDNEDCIDIVKDKEYFYEKYIRFNETYYNACKDELDDKLDDIK